MSLDATKLTEFNEYLKEIADDKTAISLSLHKSMELFNYIPKEVQELIVSSCNTTYGHLTGVISFFTYFTEEEQGEVVIDLCEGTSCYLCDSKSVIHKVKTELKIDFEETTKDKKFTLLSGKCFGHCDKGVSMYLNKKLYTNVTVDNVMSHIEEYINEKSK